jgi:hypothetical protein
MSCGSGAEHPYTSQITGRSVGTVSDDDDVLRLSAGPLFGLVGLSQF